MEQIDIKGSARSRHGVKLAQLLEKEEGEGDGGNAIFGTSPFRMKTKVFWCSGRCTRCKITCTTR